MAYGGASNTLGYYNPYFYANEALIWLHKALGMASRVHLGYDAERRSYGKGEYVNIRRPSSFTATDVSTSDGGTTTDLVPDSVQVQLSNWKEVKFQLTDKELAFTSERMVNEHIAPMAYALADNIDQALAALYVSAAGTVNAPTGAADAADITGVWKQMFNNKCPMNDLENMHFMVDGGTTKDLLDANAFSSYNVAGANADSMLLRGSLGQRFGFNFFSNQNVVTHTGGTCADFTGAADDGSDFAAGVSTVHIDGVTDGGTVKAGDSIKFAGHETTYVITADATFTGGESDVLIAPALTDAVVDDEVATCLIYDGPANLAFHKNFAALVTAPLADTGNGIGARIATVTDPLTGISLRSRVWYEGQYSSTFVGLDVLYGVKVLDEALGCKMINTP